MKMLPRDWSAKTNILEGYVTHGFLPPLTVVGDFLGPRYLRVIISNYFILGAQIIILSLKRGRVTVGYSINQN